MKNVKDDQFNPRPMDGRGTRITSAHAPPPRNFTQEDLVSPKYKKAAVISKQ